MLLKWEHSIIAETGIFAVFLATVLVLLGDFIQTGGANFFSVRVAMPCQICVSLVHRNWWDRSSEKENGFSRGQAIVKLLDRIVCSL